MEEWGYENTHFRIFAWVLVLVGDIFLLSICIMISFAIIFPNFDTTLHISSLPLFLLFCLAWNILGGYLLFNTPKSLTLTEKGLLIAWSKRKKICYAWNTIELITIGLNPTPVIIIKQQESSSLSHKVSKKILFTGWSPKYKELINRIENFKQITTNS